MKGGCSHQSNTNPKSSAMANPVAAADASGEVRRRSSPEDDPRECEIGDHTKHAEVAEQTETARLSSVERVEPGLAIPLPRAATAVFSRGPGA